MTASPSFCIHYQKGKHANLFQQIQSGQLSSLQATDIQQYIPIYDRFFALNQSNWNSIHLNQRWHVTQLKEQPTKTGDKDVRPTLIGTIEAGNIKMSSKKNVPVFVKMAPLLDPFKYLVGKYNLQQPGLFQLPTLDKTQCHPKCADPNNASYVDGLFGYLSSQTLHQHGWLHGLDYFGSSLAIVRDFKLNILDDLDYLTQSFFFNQQKGTLFHVEDYSAWLSPEPQLKPITISKANISLGSCPSLNDDLFEDLFDSDVTDGRDICESSNMDLLEPQVASFEPQVASLEPEAASPRLTQEALATKQTSTASSVCSSKSTFRSTSTCSSRTSHTCDDQKQDQELKDDEMDISSDCEYETISSSSSYSHLSQQECLFATFPQFPVQLIYLEKCTDTLDNLLNDDDVPDEHIVAALMQIIMTLIAYQHMFSFTHNDLHTNNIMFVPTDKTHLYYQYQKVVYKVPTYGRLFKIIDFGRAIYMFQGKIFCSDSFKPGGDAASQYNCEPYLNDKKPRLDPNPSFDLCRLVVLCTIC